MKIIVDQNKILQHKYKTRRRIKSLFAWCIAVIYLFPVYWMINTSLKTGHEMFDSPPTFFPTIYISDHIKRLLRETMVFGLLYGILQ